MIESLILFIHIHLLPLGGLGVFIASVIEEVLAPIPSAAVIFASGFLLVKGSIGVGTSLDLLFKVAIPAALGITLGSLLVYGIAYYAGKPILTRWGKWLGVSWEDVEKIQLKFSQTSFDEASLFAIRAIPIVPSTVISAFCGLIRFPLRAYLVYSVLGLIVRAGILGFVGWQIGTLYFHYAKFVALFENLILIGVVVFVIAFVAWRIYKYKQNQKSCML